MIYAILLSFFYFFLHSEIFSQTMCLQSFYSTECFSFLDYCSHFENKPFALIMLNLSFDFLNNPFEPYMLTSRVFSKDGSLDFSGYDFVHLSHFLALKLVKIKTC